MRTGIVITTILLGIAAAPGHAQDAAVTPDAAHTPQPVIGYAADSGNKRLPYGVAIYPGPEMDNAYPHDALLARTAGKTLLRCDWNETGALSQCQVVSDDPAAAGFGAAAVELVEKAGHVYASNPQKPLVAGTGMTVSITWETAPSPCEVADHMMNSDVVQCTSFIGSRGLMDSYPEKAVEDAREGQAVLDCSVVDEAGHVGCTVASETPAGYGFGASAVRSTAKFLRVAARQPGQPITGARFTFTFNFSLH